MKRDRRSRRAVQFASAAAGDLDRRVLRVMRRSLRVPDAGARGHGLRCHREALPVKDGQVSQFQVKLKVGFRLIA